MVKKFLNFVDVATNYGEKRIRATELLRMFGAANGMTEQHINTLRDLLECKGIL